MGVYWKNNCQNLDEQIDEMQHRLSLPRAVCALLVGRGIAADGIDSFLHPELANLSDPYRFPGIERAAARLWDAIFQRETILIHGDYDTDGITATALLSLVLRKNGAKVVSFIPHRFDDGYGFTPESLNKAFSMTPQCKVLVTVDCGITSCDAVNGAVEKGIDVIITDHHEAGPELPKALALINSKIYPELADLQPLSGAGASFKLAHAFVKYGQEQKLCGAENNMHDVLDYVALGTVADIVPLTGENRILVRHGIEILRRQIRPGIRALIESSHLRGELHPSDITFKLAPRINAAGRVGDANVALKLLEAENIVDAYGFAAQLEQFNGIRQDKEQEIYREAKEQIERNLAWQSKYVLLVAGRNWHQGVIGIVASRLARDYNKPAIVLTIQDDVAYGSGRSVGNLNLVEVLSRTAPLLERYGGHPMAVGVGLKAENIAPFYDALDAEVSKVIAPDDLKSVIAYDGTIGIHEITPEFFRYMDMIGPFGHSNPKPLFRLNSMTVTRCMPVGIQHTRGTMVSRTGQIEFIAFNQPVSAFANQTLDVLATPQINTRYNNNEIQLNIVATELGDGF